MYKKEKEYVLAVVQEKESQQLCQILRTLTEKYNTELTILSNPLDGLQKCKEYAPCMLILDADMPMLNGFSLCAILQGMGIKATIYMLIESYNYRLELLNKIHITCFLLKSEQELMYWQLTQFFEKRMMKIVHLDEIQRAKLQQSSILPKRIQNDAFFVDYIYSPYNELSGDCVDFWCGEDAEGLYGFLFDCAGHDICSFLQVAEVRAHFRYGFRFYRKKMYVTIAEIMQHVNQEIFCLHGNKLSCVAAVAFHFDFKKQSLQYCSAGMPSFFIRKVNQSYEEIEMINPLLGYKENVNFQEQCISLNNLDEVIFSSDGFSELFYKNNKILPSPQHDDVSAIYIQLKKLKRGNEEK